MGYSSLAVDYIPSPCNWGKRPGPVTKITLHHMAVVNGDPRAVAKALADPNRHASATYCIGSDGTIICGLDESIAPGTSGPGTPGKNNDLQAVTMEIANSKGAPNWEISDTALNRVIELCVDICKRNNIAKLNYTGDANGNLTYHQMFSATACPGPYLISKMSYIADEVNKRLNGVAEVPKPTQPETPAKTTEEVYTVKKGDTLSKIAAKYNTTVEQICKDNKIKNPNFIKAGQKLVIKKEEKVVEQSKDEVKQYTTTARLNVRKGPGTQYKVLTVLDKGVKVTVYKKQGEWAKIDPNSEWYVNTNWLK